MPNPFNSFTPHSKKNVQQSFRTYHAKRLLGAALCALCLQVCLAFAIGRAAYADDLDQSQQSKLEFNQASNELDSEDFSATLDSYLETNFPRTHEPGIAVAVVTDHGIAYMNTLGTCDDASSTFFIGSLSKSMCATAIMQLVQQGKIDLDAPAVEYAPEYLISPDVSVRMLLNQTSGFGFYESLNQATVGDSFGEFSYANANYDLLGRIVEHVSGEAYSDYLAKHVFAPLDMADSSAQGWRTNDVLGENDDSDTTSQTDEAHYTDTRDVLGHRNYFGLYVQDDFQHRENDDAWGGPSSGYVSSSIRDMANYLQMYLAGGKNVLDYDSVMQMFMSRVPDPSGDAYYGMGWTSYYWDDELVLCHDGDVETNVASMTILPERGIGVVVLGDGYDSVAGNSLFWDLSSGVVDIACGLDTPDLDAEEYDRLHDETNTQWFVFWLICAIPLLILPVWHTAAKAIRASNSKPLAMCAIVLDAALFAWAILKLLRVPKEMGIPWRDVSTFDPSMTIGIAAGVALLTIAAIARIAIASLIAIRHNVQTH